MTLTADDPRRIAVPTVLGAMRRHRLLVGFVIAACVELAFAYGALRQDEYLATATVSAPRPAGSALQSDAQYLDSQVLLLNSREVGDRALQVAQATSAGAGIRRVELEPTIGKVEIIPPAQGSSGSYGSTIVTIHFTAPSAAEAQAGVNALATAYDELRSAQIEESATARLQGIDQAIANTDSASDVAALRRERVRALIDQGRDLGLSASISAAGRPQAPTNPGLLTLAATGLLLGLILGAVAAFARATQSNHVGSAHVAHQLYGASMLLQRPADPSRETVGLTEPKKLLGRVVAHRLRTLEHSSVVAVVATPRNAGRSMTAACLALAMAEGEVPVVAVDGGEGTMAQLLGPGATKQVGRPGRAGPAPAVSPLHPSLSVLDFSGHGTEWWEQRLAETKDRVVVVDCPPPSTSARAVDLLSHCDAAVILVRADDTVDDHAEVARWLEVTGVVVLGYVFSPYSRQGPRKWWRAIKARARLRDAGAQRSATHPPLVEPVYEMRRQPRSRPVSEDLRASVEEQGA